MVYGHDSSPAFPPGFSSLALVDGSTGDILTSAAYPISESTTVCKSRKGNYQQSFL